MAAPVLSITTDDGAFSGPANATPHMVRYELSVALSGTTGYSNVVTIANDATTSGPNLFLDCLSGSPLQRQLSLRVNSQQDAVEAILENDNLRVTLTSADTSISFGVEPINIGSAPPILHLRAWALDGGATSDVKGTLTIEFRHSIIK